MPNIVIPETFIPCVNDPDLIGASNFKCQQFNRLKEFIFSLKI